MFKIENNQIHFCDFVINIPYEALDETIIKVFGTATHGLTLKVGYLSSRMAGMGIAVVNEERIEGLVLDDAQITDTVFVREQYNVKNNEILWLISKKPIDLQLNWINFITKNGNYYKICPFTFEYIKNGINIS